MIMKLLILSITTPIVSSFIPTTPIVSTTSPLLTPKNELSISHDVSKQDFSHSHTECFMSESAMEPESTTTTTVTSASSSSSSSPPSSPMKGKTKMSEAIPFLKCPTYLDGELAGDVGFDPLGLGKNKEGVLEMREAEIKHARLAMLAAVGWPLSELFDKPIASYFEISPILDATDRAPSLLNGGLDKVIPEWWGFCLGLTGAIDLYGIQKSRTSSYNDDDDVGDESGEAEAYFPGNLGFDPLGLYPLDEEGRANMQLAEIKHGRTAMLAVVGYAAQEAFYKVGVVDETPFFFKPLF